MIPLKHKRFFPVPLLSFKRNAFFSREIIPVLSTHFLQSLVFCGAKFAPLKPAFLFSLHFYQHLFVTWFVRPSVPNVTWYHLLRSHDALMCDKYLYKLCHHVMPEIISVSSLRYCCIFIFPLLFACYSLSRIIYYIPLTLDMYYISRRLKLYTLLQQYTLHLQCLLSFIIKKMLGSIF